MACLHARVGVPRWLTAATISLGIVFSVWLCLVIPSAAPKQRIRALVIKTEKPSAALAKAKEAEACSKACEAAGVDPSTVVSVVRVDLPPSYGDVRPASPAPSYKSEMGVPASPAPSYRSVAPGKEDAAGGEIDMFQCSGLFLPLLHDQHCIKMLGHNLKLDSYTSRLWCSLIPLLQIAQWCWSQCTRRPRRAGPRSLVA